MKKVLVLFFIGLANISNGQDNIDSLIVDLGIKYHQKKLSTWNDTIDWQHSDTTFRNTFLELTKNDSFGIYLFEKDNQHLSYDSLKNIDHESIEYSIQKIRIKLFGPRLKDKNLALFSINTETGGMEYGYMNYALIKRLSPKGKGLTFRHL